ncbi:hypothetical protein A3F66_03700 [candidate division TM6 bacterium RIFCSPHIGHO2_12_FULL_32_22]|nr:MAG: hypothetical protein A3F66_03700 [candidate division TM6 bacterium RIFCSPHIGHO2_12_FULL_32_22]
MKKVIFLLLIFVMSQQSYCVVGDPCTSHCDCTTPYGAPCHFCVSGKCQVGTPLQCWGKMCY